MTSPVDTVRRFYDALGRGDVSGVLATLDEKLEWTEAERFPHSSHAKCYAVSGEHLSEDGVRWRNP